MTSKVLYDAEVKENLCENFETLENLRGLNLFRYENRDFCFFNFSSVFSFPRLNKEQLDILSNHVPQQQWKNQQCKT